MRCNLRLSPDCAREAEVRFTSPRLNGATCVACGKAYQAKFSRDATGLSILPLEPLA